MVQGAEKKFIESRVNLPTDKGSAEIARDIPAVIRARAFFSARVAEAHILERFREISDRYSSGEISRDEARHLLRQFARSEGKDDGTKALRNLASTARLNLILDQNAKMARAVGQYETMHRPANLQMFPYVIYRASVGSKHPRGSHRQFDGKVIAKNDPWLKNHWPPWEFGCNCDLQNCTAKKAAGLPGLTDEDRKVASQSGFEFDPSTAFEEFDYSLIKDYELREKARVGVENILKDVSDENKSDKLEFLSPQPEFMVNGKKFEEFVDGLEARISPEMLAEINAPKTNAQCKAEARAAVPPEVMAQTDAYVKSLPQEALLPLYQYTNKDEAGVNRALRQKTQTSEEMDAITAFSKLLENGPKFRGTCFRGCFFESKQAASSFVRKLLDIPEDLTGFTSLSPDFETALYYALKGQAQVIIVIPESANGVYWGPYSSQPRDHETTLDYKFYLKGLEICEKGDKLYVLAKEMRR